MTYRAIILHGVFDSLELGGDAEKQTDVVSGGDAVREELDESVLQSATCPKALISGRQLTWQSP